MKKQPHLLKALMSDGDLKRLQTLLANPKTKGSIRKTLISKLGQLGLKAKKADEIVEIAIKEIMRSKT